MVQEIGNHFSIQIMAHLIAKCVVLFLEFTMELGMCKYLEKRETNPRALDWTISDKIKPVKFSADPYTGLLTVLLSQSTQYPIITSGHYDNINRMLNAKVKHSQAKGLVSVDTGLCFKFKFVLFFIYSLSFPLRQCSTKFTYTLDNLFLCVIQLWQVVLINWSGLLSVR